MIRITVKDQEYTLEEAKELYIELMQLFGIERKEVSYVPFDTEVVGSYTEPGIYGFTDKETLNQL